jgi:hypothetical protein
LTPDAADGGLTFFETPDIPTAVAVTISNLPAASARQSARFTSSALRTRSVSAANADRPVPIYRGEFACWTSTCCGAS